MRKSYANVDNVTLERVRKNAEDAHKVWEVLPDDDCDKMSALATCLTKAIQLAFGDDEAAQYMAAMQYLVNDWNSSDKKR